jgi:GT2 family glycosyltransferase
LALVDHDDLLSEEALSEMASALKLSPNAVYLYSDEDKLDARGNHYDVFAKPAWSPERLRGQMYTGHLSVLLRSAVELVGGFRPECEGSQDHDLVLRVSELPGEKVHVPKVLYHWRASEASTASSAGNKPYAWTAGVKAVNDHLIRVGIAGTAEFGPVPGTYRILRETHSAERICVIIPTRGSEGVIGGESRVFVIEAVRSLVATIHDLQVNIVIVHDSATAPWMLTCLKEIAGSLITFVPFEGTFNFSRKCNLGFLASEEEICVFLNDDVEIITPDFLGQLVAPLRETDVGLVGAKLLFEDGSIQHAGHSYEDGVFRNSYSLEGRESYGYFSSLLINREASGLTAACVALRRSDFFEIGGFSETLPGNFNDVDLSFKIRSLGRRIIWLANLESYHYESKSRVTTVHGFEEEIVLQRWGRPNRDPFRSEAPG